MGFLTNLVDQATESLQNVDNGGPTSASAATPTLSGVDLSKVKFSQGPSGFGTIVSSPLGPMTLEAFTATIQAMAKKQGLSTDDLGKALSGAGLNFALGGDGKLTLTGQGGTPYSGAPYGDTRTPTAGGTSASGGSYAGAGGSYGGGGSSGGTFSNGADWGGGGGGQPVASRTIESSGGALGGIDPNKPLGVDFGKFSGAPVGGSPMFRSGTFPSAGDPFAQLGPNSTAADVAAALAKKQFANQQAALGIQGGLYDAQGSDPTLQGARGLAGQLAANPFSLDEATQSRIAGRSIDAIGQRAGRLEQGATARAAASGQVGGSGLDTQIGSIQSDAARQASDAERAIQIEAATRRPGELQSALGAVGGFGLNDAQNRQGIGNQATNILGSTSIYGDAALTGALGSGISPQSQGVAYTGPGYRL